MAVTARRAERPQQEAPKSSRRTNAQGERVRELLLETAERLFSERGYFGTSIRDITDAAQLRLASVNYHFGTKEALFRDVILRRAGPLNARRVELLDRALAASRAGKPRVEDIIEAFVMPVAELSARNVGYRRYFALIAATTSSRMWTLTLLAEHFSAVAARFVDALAASYPRADTRALLSAYQLTLGTTLFAFSGNLRIESQSKGRVRLEDYGALAQSVVAFTAAGVDRMLGERPKATRGSVRPLRPTAK